VKTAQNDGPCPVIALDKFIQATRDSGYKGTPSAISELVDNAIQAGATEISIRIDSVVCHDGKSIEVAVLDNGCGMDPFTLRQALRFGGTTRFGNRDGLGRYGMGLPNSSLSQARRVTVFTWQPGTDVYMSYLDVDEISEGDLTEVPVPSIAELPLEPLDQSSGTVVLWTRCDRLDNRKPSTIVRKLLVALGRRFRHFIWDGVNISLNGEPVEPFDPLFLHPRGKHTGAMPFGDQIEYEVHVSPDSGTNSTGIVRVVFSELPVNEWHRLSNEEKGLLGITKGAGVSVVRAGREVDYGWFFLGRKRRENYDDWWRCEIHFEPVLDEAFGITHTKQQIRPKPYLFEALSPDIEATARALNARVRRAHLAAKQAERFSDSETLACDRERLLVPLGGRERERDQVILQDLESRCPEIRRNQRQPSNSDCADQMPRLAYKIVEASTRDRFFFTYAVKGDRLVLAINPQHPFYKQVYAPLVESDAPGDVQLRTQLELLLLSLARAEAAEEDQSQVEYMDRRRLEWSNTLATFLNG